MSLLIFFFCQDLNKLEILFVGNHFKKIFQSDEFKFHLSEHRLINDDQFLKTFARDCWIMLFRSSTFHEKEYRDDQDGRYHSQECSVSDDY